MQSIYLWLIHPRRPGTDVPAMLGVSDDYLAAQDEVFGSLRHTRAQGAMVFEAAFDDTTRPGQYLLTGRQWLAWRDGDTTGWWVKAPIARRRRRRSPSRFR